VVQDCKPTVLIVDFTNVSAEGLSKFGYCSLASFVAMKYGRTLCTKMPLLLSSSWEHPEKKSTKALVAKTTVSSGRGSKPLGGDMFRITL
jgi:hypothetical protein